jgi:acyl-CoA reductase-like NAD-dependent aldehyde dehydrogenase
MSQRPDGVERFLHPTGHVIDGGHVAAANGATLPVEDPSTAEVFSAIPAGDAGDIDAAVRKHDEIKRQAEAWRAAEQKKIDEYRQAKTREYTKACDEAVTELKEEEESAPKE